MQSWSGRKYDVIEEFIVDSKAECVQLNLARTRIRSALQKLIKTD